MSTKGIAFKQVGSPQARFMFPNHTNLHFMRNPVLQALRDRGLLVPGDPAPIKEWLEKKPKERYLTLKDTPHLGEDQLQKLFAAFDLPDPMRPVPVAEPAKPRDFGHEIDLLKEKIVMLESVIEGLITRKQGELV